MEAENHLGVWLVDEGFECLIRFVDANSNWKER